MEAPQAGKEVGVGPGECYRGHQGAPQAGYDTEGDLCIDLGDQRLGQDRGWGEPWTIHGYCRGVL